MLLTNYARVTQDLSAELGSSNTAGLSCAAVEAVEQQLINEANGVTADEIECPVCAPAPPRTCADLNADGTTDDPFDCSSETNDIDAVPASITCSGATCTAAECCTAVPSEVCSEQVQLNAAGQAQGNAAAGCDCVEPTTVDEFEYASVAACLNTGGIAYDFAGEYGTTGCHIVSDPSSPGLAMHTSETSGQSTRTRICRLYRDRCTDHGSRTSAAV